MVVAAAPEETKVAAEERGERVAAAAALGKEKEMKSNFLRGRVLKKSIFWLSSDLF